jgi:hypothetical protein
VELTDGVHQKNGLGDEREEVAERGGVGGCPDVRLGEGEAETLGELAHDAAS